MQRLFSFIYTHVRPIHTLICDLIFPEPKEAQIIRNITPDDIKRFPRANPAPTGHALWDYAHPIVKELIWHIKYYENITVLPLVALYLSAYIRSHIHTASASKPLLLIPIPISRARKTERGFNQTEYLASAVHTHLHAHTHIEVAYNPDILRKKHDTAHQTAHTKQHRLKNLHDSFTVQTHLPLKAYHICVIDDVITTGATLEEAVRVLRDAGAETISCLAVAH